MLAAVSAEITHLIFHVLGNDIKLFESAVKIYEKIIQNQGFFTLKKSTLIVEELLK